MTLDSLLELSTGESNLKAFSGFFKKDFIYFLERKGGRKRGKNHWCIREISIGCFSNAPNWGRGLQRRHVPCPGIEQATFWLAGPCPTHWTTPVRDSTFFFFLPQYFYSVKVHDTYLLQKNIPIIFAINFMKVIVKIYVN